MEPQGALSFLPSPNAITEINFFSLSFLQLPSSLTSLSEPRVFSLWVFFPPPLPFSFFFLPLPSPRLPRRTWT